MSFFGGFSSVFYERLRTIATAAKLEAAAACCNGGNYAVIRKFPEDIAHKFPMPWHAPGKLVNSFS